MRRAAAADLSGDKIVDGKIVETPETFQARENEQVRLEQRDKALIDCYVSNGGRVIEIDP